MMTTDNGTAVTITHPDWCFPAWCTAHEQDGYTAGDHLHGVETFRPRAGGQLEVVLSREAADGDGPSHYVTVLRPVDQDFECAGEDTDVNRRIQGDPPIFLEPEEARMLARFLCTAADKWDELHGGAR